MTNKRKLEDTEPSSTPVDWKKFKQEKRELTLKRKQKNKLFDIYVKCKKLYEQFKPKVIKGGKVKRSKLIQELHLKLKDNRHYEKLVLSHDMARVVQCMLKYAPNEIREEISNEIIGVVPQMFISKYGVHCVQQLLKYGTEKIKSQVIEACYGNVVKFVSHVVSAYVLDYAYKECASALQKKHFVQEFFSDIYKQSKDDSINHLRDTYKTATSLKSAVLNATKINLNRILNKQLLDLALVHTVMLQYLEECTSNDRDELIGQLAEHVAVLSNSSDGSRVAMRIIWFSNNKNRKVIMKALKDHIIDLCGHEFGHLTILALLDSIDDTVLLNKIVLATIVDKALDLVSNEYGRRTLTWLVSPFDKTVFNSNLLEELEKGRLESVSKKDTEIRRNEIRNHVIKPLLISLSDNFDNWFSISQHALVAFHILKQDNGENNLDSIFEKLAKFITSTNWKVKVKESDTKTIYGIEHTGFHIVLKKLIENDTKHIFKNYLSQNLTNEIMEIWIKLNRGCFLLSKMLESIDKWNNNDLVKNLNSNLNLIKEQNSAGSKVLLEKLRN